MSLTEAIRDRLKAVPALREQVRDWGDTRIIRQAPKIIVAIVADPRPQHFKGLQKVRATQVQIDVWALTGAVAETLREAAIAALVPPARVNGINFQRATIDNVRAASLLEQGGAERRPQTELYGTSIDVTFWHNG